MAGKPCCRQKEEWQTANLRRLHDLNKARSKDSFPLPQIDRIVEATAGNELLSFMDAFSGYNQITMHPEDREKTSFITDRGTYCYKVMPFGLKNAGATYQRLVNHMLVKSLTAGDHIGYLQACFTVLNQYQMKLNPTKCIFGVTSGEFLGYIVTKRGIKANPKQIDALINLPSPRNTREVQRLTGRIAALNRFISRSIDKCLPFYQLLRGNKRFEWDNKCEEAFQQLKEYLASPPILAKPETGETLYLYIAVSSSAVSGVLVKEDRGEQKPIFYVSKTLDDAEKRYPTLEKLALAVIIPSQSRRIAKWVVELTEYDIEYRNKTSAKSQVLADFLVELPPELIQTDLPDEKWSLYVDGSSSSRGAGIGIRLESPTKEILEQSFRLEFPASNNEAEYKVLLAGLRLAQGIGVKKIEAFCDSELVAREYSGDYDTRNDRMDLYLKAVKNLTDRFESFSLTRIPRSDNTSADALAALASTSESHQRRVIPVESIDSPSIVLPRGVCAVRELEANRLDAIELPPLEVVDEPAEQEPTTEDWRIEILLYITDGQVPPDRWAARRLKVRSDKYIQSHGNLYRWSSTGALLNCLHGEETLDVMRETHEGACENHSNGRALALKIKNHGHFWPTMLTDCDRFVARCEQCQRHAPMINAPAELLATSSPPYPFMRWAMDIIIICRHGLPYEIVTDNGPQFISDVFEDFCAKWRIRLNKSTPRYPQRNGQAEATNKTILDGIKKRLEDKKGLWADELDGVLWSHRTTPRRSTNKTPFSLSHGMEALAPTEVSLPTIRRTMLTQDGKRNRRMMKDSLDMLEEELDHALLRMQNYQQ
ncbi:uncharacterized protein LOC112084676 [Eutrema salsugineum]|uniref:uncharacterized protein LOC112084676 n=1 Tax=Eutrema salsugineum TaxID=72664 RepID=UPI000CED6E05|nr:uncharacterized protein LOC112084676 [Eutrema salsugineum]